MLDGFNTLQNKFCHLVVPRWNKSSLLRGILAFGFVVITSFKKIETSKVLSSTPQSLCNHVFYHLRNVSKIQSILTLKDKETILRLHYCKENPFHLP